MGKTQRPFGTPHKVFKAMKNDQRKRQCHHCGRTLTLSLDHAGWRQWCRHVANCQGPAHAATTP